MGKRFRIVLRAYVVPNTGLGVYIGHPAWIRVHRSGRGYHKLDCDFRDGEIVTLEGLSVEGGKKRCNNKLLTD